MKRSNGYALTARNGLSKFCVPQVSLDSRPFLSSFVARSISVYVTLFHIVNPRNNRNLNFGGSGSFL